MSAEAMGDAFRHSPHNGSALCVHLAVADVVNDAHGNELWMTRAALARKARASRGTVDRVIGLLIETGWLEVLEGGGGRGKATRYRYYLGGETASPVRGFDGETASSATETASSAGFLPLTIPKNPRAPDDSVAARAQGLVRGWWETCEPRPMVNYLGAVQIVKKALAAGWTDEQVAEALPGAQPLAGWRLEQALKDGKRGPVTRTDGDWRPSARERARMDEDWQRGNDS